MSVNLAIAQAKGEVIILIFGANFATSHAESEMVAIQPIEINIENDYPIIACFIACKFLEPLQLMFDKDQ